MFADINSANQSQTGIAVDYGDVEIGGKTYTCPLLSVAFDRASPSPGNGAAPLLTYLNDVTFTKYHLFRSEVRIVP